MLVHFASGEHCFPRPWHNVDYNTKCDQKVDLLEDFPENLADIEVAYVGHFLEHLTVDEGVVFLGRVLDRMRPGGRVVIVGPDAVKGQAWYDSGRIPLSLLEAIKTHGDPIGNNRGNCHLWDCTGDAVVSQLTEAGWIGAHEVPMSRFAETFPNVPLISDVGWQFSATACAPGRT